MFEPVDSSVSFPKLEERIVQFWKDRGIYEKSLEMRTDAPAFVFYEGPPTANGLPHPGHCLTRSIKDLFPRYKTMRGFRCERKAGWDTHGLPVEVEVCKELGIHSKEEIEEYGVEPFIHKCLESVFRYTRQWEELTERLGFWIHLDEAYVTYHQSYVESVWWSLKNLFDRGLLYQGHKIVWWWAQGGTALSSGEVGEGYREVADPSVYVRFPLIDESDTDLLVWTTTPWTLPSNQFAAVHPDLEYSIVAFEGEDRNLVIASELVETIAGKVGKEFNVRSTTKGSEILGKRYRPPFDYYYKTLGESNGKLKDGGSQAVAWRVVAADFVTTDSGTGVVHQAPAFGEVDYDVLLAEQARFADGEGPELICAVGPDGKFTNEAPDYEGRWVKEADKDLSRQLRAEETLFHLEQYLHDYPFCWRADDDPLIQYPRKSWFIRTTEFKDRMVANNKQINWLPEHIRDGRFGNFLESNVDWALSRERYWGTPLPIWVCEETGYMEAVGNYDELLAKPGVDGTEVWDEAKKANPDLSDDLKIHKPYIDAVTYESPKAPGKRMRRVPEVIDCWYDSGAMPFAQWGYPHKDGSRERFAGQFPADFISEAIDQTRGWFYSQLAISTLMFSEANSKDDATRTVDYPHPFANCIVLGLMLSEWWESKDGKEIFLSEDEARKALGKGNYVHKTGKMSKSLRNYRSPDEIFNTYGADALRWYFFANQAPWTSIIYSEQAIKECIPGFLLRLWNVYGFFTIYANIDEFEPASEIAGEVGQLLPEVLGKAKTYRPIVERSELDQWILSELNQTVAAVTKAMDAYDNFGACGRLNRFVDALSNWYVRRSRDRFWGSGASEDKIDGYWTLYECLVTTTKLIAPFVPFLAEKMWQNLVVVPFGDRAAESVHLCDYPACNRMAVNEALSTQMALVREVVSLGRSARMGAKLKVRQPLAQVEIVLADQTYRPWLESHSALIREELNVKAVEFSEQADQYISYSILPDLKRLGPKLGKKVPAVRKHLASADGAVLLAELEANGKVSLQLEEGTIELDSDDIQVRLQAKEGWAAAQGADCVVVLATELTDEFITEGFAYEIVRAVQNHRKEMDCEYTDRIEVGLVTESPELLKAIENFGDYIATETLIVSGKLGIVPVPGAQPVELKLAGHAVTLYVKVTPN